MTGTLANARTGQAYVYFLLDADRTVVYIGSTRRLRQRVREHESGPIGSTWDSLYAEPYETIDAALTDESRLISLAQPALNRRSRKSGPSLLDLMCGMVIDGQVPDGDDLRLMGLLSKVTAA